MQIDLNGKEVNETNKNSKPFLKWAGGKSQLLGEIEKRLPEEIVKKKKIEKYIEPFIGGGAVFFHIINNYKVKKSYINDINSDLILSYKIIKNNHLNLIDSLCEIQEEYLNLGEDDKKEYFYNIRTKYNEQLKDINYGEMNELSIERVAMLIFLNKTCFNGLYRHNLKGEFNTPHGRYKNPTICDKDNIKSVSKSLKNTTITSSDFKNTLEYIEKGSFIYLDPPYRPISKTASFKSYSKENFNDDEQKRLKKYCDDLNNLGAFFILSNSDPKNEDPDDNFFDELYSNYTIERIKARRYINSNKSKRGNITEIMVNNYKTI